MVVLHLFLLSCETVTANQAPTKLRDSGPLDQKVAIHFYAIFMVFFLAFLAVTCPYFASHAF